MIITVRDEQGSFFCDLEVPDNISMEKAESDILEALNCMNEVCFRRECKYMLIHNRTGQNFANKEKLQDAGIWNGDYITVIRQG